MRWSVGLSLTAAWKSYSAFMKSFFSKYSRPLLIRTWYKVRFTVVTIMMFRETKMTDFDTAKTIVLLLPVF